MKKRTKPRKPTPRVSSAEEQQERAELQRYRASVHRIQEIERLAKKLRHARLTMRESMSLLVEDFLRDVRQRAVSIEPPAAVNE